MTEEEKQLLMEHANALAKILYKNAPVEELTSLGKIESVVLPPNAGACHAIRRCFFIENATGESTGHKREIKSIIGKLPVTSSQAKKLELRPHSQLSPYLEACCLRASACVSYERALLRCKVCNRDRSAQKRATATCTPSGF